MTAIGACPNCRRPLREGEADNAGWCGTCRRTVVRRSTWSAHVVASLAAILALWLIVSTVRPAERTALIWLILLAGLYFVLFRLARRVAFELIRGRGVPPPREE